MTDDRPLYLVFGRWIEAREFASANGLVMAEDVFAAAQHHVSLAVIRETERRIVLVRTASPVAEYEAPSWRILAALARDRNEQNDYISEVMNV